MKNILLYNSGGGIGDSIQLFSLILSLKNHFRTSNFYYLGAHENHFKGKLKEYNIDIETLNLKIKYFGFRWWHLIIAKKRFDNLDLKEFDLVIDLQSKIRNTLVLKKLPHKNFYSATYNFKFSTKKAEYTENNHLQNLTNFLNTNINILKFNSQNLPEKYINEAKRLLPDNNYIGFSITQGNIYRKKSWSINNFITLASKIEGKNQVPVFFIEKSETDLIKRIKSELPHALFPEMHSKIACPALVTALASRLRLAISIDNGVMHMIGLANIPMIVLFGPTDSEKFAPKIDIIKVIDSKKLYNSKDINKITVHDVYKLI